MSHDRLHDGGIFALIPRTDRSRAKVHQHGTVPRLHLAELLGRKDKDIVTLFGVHGLFPPSRKHGEPELRDFDPLT
jgi:hypothetical protein